MRGQRDRDEGRRPLAYTGRIDQHDVAGDDTALLELFDAVERGSRGQPKPPRQFHVGDAAVLLKPIQDLAVDLVKHERFHKLVWTVIYLAFLSFYR